MRCACPGSLLAWSGSAFERVRCSLASALGRVWGGVRLVSSTQNNTVAWVMRAEGAYRGQERGDGAHPHARRLRRLPNRAHESVEKTGDCAATSCQTEHPAYLTSIRSNMFQTVQQSPAVAWNGIEKGRHQRVRAGTVRPRP